MPLSDDQIERIARHTFEKEDRVHRFDKEKYGPPMNIAAPNDLANAIRAAARDAKTEHIARAGGGYFIRQPGTNLTVLADGQGGGTAYRDKDFEKDFERNIKRDNKIREERGLPPAQKVIGPVPLERDSARHRAQERARETLLARSHEQARDKKQDKGYSK